MFLAICNGQKTMTSRNSRYPLGTHAYYLHGWALVIQVYEVKRMRLGTVARVHYQAEGFSNGQQFIDVWNEIHPKKRFSSLQQIWAHRFRVLEARRCE
jgi:hypothetical protein